MTLPGWDSLETAKVIASRTEVTTLCFWVLLVLFEIIARSWKRLAKVFDVLALFAFALAVSGEIVEHKYNQRKEALYEAREQRLSAEFNRKLEKANEDAQKARDSSTTAQQDASAAQKEAAELRHQQAGRALSAQQKAQLLSLLKLESPQELYFLSAPDSESQTFADQLFAILRAAGWKTSLPPYNWGTVQHYPVGVVILTADLKNAPRGAVVLQGSLKKIGIESSGLSFEMVPAGKFGLFVGLKPQPK
jgi:hypothetical protein